MLTKVRISRRIPLRLTFLAASLPARDLLSGVAREEMKKLFSVTCSFHFPLVAYAGFFLWSVLRSISNGLRHIVFHLRGTTEVLGFIFIHFLNYEIRIEFSKFRCPIMFSVIFCVLLNIQWYCGASQTGRGLRRTTAFTGLLLW